ncbi:MAG: T9SS type A sorting domain-containing protein [Hymenobacteraceae bacterium]|nr:T9SS type A sorting domain-containing protein [Hymenobacteraceae bacterium]
MHSVRSPRLALSLRGRALYLPLLLLNFVLPARAQSGFINTYHYAPGTAAGQASWLLPAPAGRAGYVLAGYGRCGFDSSFANVAHLRADLTVRASRAYRLRNALSYVMTASAAPNGYLIGGGANSSGAAAYVASLDTALAPRWSAVFPDLGSAQRYVIKVLPRSATEFAAYTYTDGGDDDRLYALSGKLTGVGFRARQLTPTPAGATGRVRVFEGFAPEVRKDRHYLVGTGRSFPNAREQDALVLKLDSSRVRWGKLLDFGRPNEAIYSIITTADGHLVVPVVNYGFAGTINPTIVCKLDTAGNLLWARKVSLPGGASLYLPVVAETLAGELVLAGSDANNDLMIIKLSATGTLRWARRAAGSGSILGKLTRTGAGTFVLAGPGFTLTQFDAAGYGCNLVDDATVVATAVPLTVSPVLNFPFTTTALTPATLRQTLTPRAQSLTRSLTCEVVVGLPAEARQNVLAVYPNPTTGFVRVTRLPIEARTPLTAVEVFDARGRPVRHQLVTGAACEIDLRGLPAGLYLVRAGSRAASVVLE